jgi:hypothetical protein
MEKFAVPVFSLYPLGRFISPSFGDKNKGKRMELVLI